MRRVGVATRSHRGFEEEFGDEAAEEEGKGTSNCVCVENAFTVDTSDQGAQDDVVSSEVVRVGIETATLCQSRSGGRVHADGETKFVRHESEGTEVFVLSQDRELQLLLLTAIESYDKRTIGY